VWEIFKSNLKSNYFLIRDHNTVVLEFTGLIELIQFGRRSKFQSCDVDSSRGIDRVKFWRSWSWLAPPRQQIQTAISYYRKFTTNEIITVMQLSLQTIKHHDSNLRFVSASTRSIYTLLLVFWLNTGHWPVSPVVLGSTLWPRNCAVYRRHIQCIFSNMAMRHYTAVDL